LDEKFTPAVATYWQSLKAREGFKKAMAKQDAVGREQGVENRVARLR
jgi:glutathione S-transferase